MKRIHTALSMRILTLMLCSLVVPAHAAQQIEHEGELKFNISNSSVAPTVRVLTEGEDILRVSLITKNTLTEKTEEFYLNHQEPTRYRTTISSFGIVRTILDHDLKHGMPASYPHQAHAKKVSNLLMRHFSQKGSYRSVNESAPRRGINPLNPAQRSYLKRLIIDSN